MRPVRRIALSLLLVLPISCGGEKAINEPTGDYVVWVFNDSPVAVSNVRVAVSDQDEFTISHLDRGGASDRYVVHVIHTDPAVTLTVGGETLASTPTEGFAGFNPPVAPGKYVITVSVSGSPRRLVVTMQKPVED